MKPYEFGRNDQTYRKVSNKTDGIQGRYLLPRLARAGHDLGIFAWYGLQGGMQTLALDVGEGNVKQVPVYPQWVDVYGNDIVEAHAKHFEADVVVTLMDAWVLREYGKKKMRWMPYMPVDHEPTPEAIIKALNGAYRVISYAEFGKRMLDDVGIDNVCIPHGVDTKVFAPRDKRAAKAKMKIDPDCFLIGMVAANKGLPSRKAFPEQLAAAAAFKQRHKNVKIYLHTLESQQHNGVDLDALLKALGFTSDEVIFVNQYQYTLGLSEDYMANAYNAMDVYLGAAMSEGFGIPLIEAQACAVPVITTNATAMPELTFSGICVEPAQRFWTALNSWIALPSIDGIVAALEWAWEYAREKKVQERARAGALAYDWDVIVQEGWLPFLNDIADEIAHETIAPSESVSPTMRGELVLA